MTDLRDPANRVHLRARTMWRVQGAIGSTVVIGALVVVAVIWTEYGARWLVVGAAVILATAYVLVVPQWRYLVHRWEITGTAVYTQHGWWARERRIAPMSRVQTVDLAQGLVERVFGLATLTVTTASAAGALRIEGLDHATAVGLVDQLTVQAEAAGGDAT